MGLRQIEYIFRTVEEKNVSRTAMKLFISQSALNQQLLKLGRELGTLLFCRTRHSWELTEIGGLYTQGAREIMLTKKNAHHRIADILDRPQRPFSLRVSGGRGIAMFTSIYLRFLQMHPNVSISPLKIRSYDIQNMIASENLNPDFITIGPREKINTNRTHIYSKKLYAAPPPSHPIARSTKNREKEYPQLDLWLLKDEPFVLMYRESSCRVVTDSTFRETGFSPNILFETSSAAGIPPFVSSEIYCIIILRCYTENMDGISLLSLPSHPY